MSTPEVAPVATSTPTETPVQTSPETIETIDGGSESSSENETSSEPEVKSITKEEIKKLKSLKLKIDGEEFDEELPFEIEDKPEVVEWMKKNLQLSKMANKRAQEKASFEKQVVSFLDDLKKNPKKALSDPRIGIDVKKFATEILEEEVLNAQKSPELLEKEKIETELKELRAKIEQEKEEHRQQELERIQAEEHQRYDMAFTSALKDANLPKSKYVVKKMADTMLSALEAGYKVEPKDVVSIVRDEIMNDVKEMFGVMPSEVVQELIGKEHISKLRKNNVAAVKEKQALAQRKPEVDVSKTKPIEKKEEKKISFKEFFKV